MDNFFSLSEKDNRELLKEFLAKNIHTIPVKIKDNLTIEELFKSFDEQSEISEHVKVKILKEMEKFKMADNSFDYFTQEYSEGQWDNNFYLWGMAALKDLHAMDPKEEYYEYVKQYTDWRISTKGNSRFTSHNYCAYIEGVVSAYSIIEPNVSSKELVFYDEEIDFWLAKSDELQVEADDIFKISFSNGPMFWLRLKNANRSIGGFLTDLKEPVQRIDFTQHCLSSYLQKHVDIDGNQL